MRKAFENASRHFDGTDRLTVNTLEAVYGQENSFGILLGTRGSSRAAGHFQFKPKTAREYGLHVSKNNDQRFDIDYASSAAARHLKYLDNIFSRTTTVRGASKTVAVKDARERYKFVLGAYNGGQRYVADAQRLAETAGRNPRVWADVQEFLESADTPKSIAVQMREYVEKVPRYEVEFAQKSPADKRLKAKQPRREQYSCTKGHWVTIDDHPVFLCV